ncbi:KRAB [Lepeophtheirus salmonis]|uniref:KRAB n=1 Tax=Lepeophtheirus salmonis TaxID=72036 RepID=A0A7R8H9J8_LEPSM|nr:KRAB [Lepeophtheirus salmonis]CAF2950855.1 KRAB [Lepeophtheirus salmonis]
MEDSGGNIGPMCICIKDHGRHVCERLQQLRLSTGLVDLDIVVEEQRLRVHKVVLAATSKFFKDQLTKANVLVPVILRLEDFGLELKREAVGYIVEFIYRGEVLIPGECLSDVCVAAHTLGIYGLVEFLPNAAPHAKELQLHTNPVSCNPAFSGSLDPSNYVEALAETHPSYSSVDPVLDDALSLLARGNFLIRRDISHKNTGDPSSSISVSTPQPTEWSDPNPTWSAPDTEWDLHTDRNDCKQTEGAWTTPAEPSLSLMPTKEASTSSWTDQRPNSEEPVVMWNPKSNTTGRTSIPTGEPFITSKEENKSQKDLTLPSAPSDGGDNVFQEEDPAVNNYPVVNLDDGDLEVDLINEALKDPSSNKIMECLNCALPFSNSTQLQKHLKLVHQNESFLPCPVCKITGLCGKEAVDIHVYKEHGMGELFRCEECSYETSIKSTYVGHMAEHAIKLDSSFIKKKHFNDTYVCSVCDFKTPQRINLIKHMASKHKKGIDGKDLSSDFKCKLCSFECVAEHLLKSHLLRKHTAKEEMKHKCASSLILYHPWLDIKRGHLQTKPHSCKLCGASYADKKRLLEHILGHSGEKPFHCKFCSYKCRRKDNLAVHVKRVHSVPSKVDNALKSSSTAVNNRESHIVGHVNQDGSIRPIVANPKPTNSVNSDASNGDQQQKCSQSEDIKIIQNRDVETSKD